MHTIKIIGAVVLLLASIAGFSIYTTNTLATTSKSLENHVIKIEDSTRAGNWEEAGLALSQIEKDWDQAQKVWSMLIDHIEIDNIEHTIARVSMYIETQNTSSALAETAVLRMYIEHIPRKESLKLENLF